MTLNEYIEAPDNWQPTYIVNNATSLNNWLNNAGGIDYERVLVAADLSANNRVNLTAAGTKQIVFAGGVTLTINANGDHGMMYDQKPESDKYWAYGIKISVTNAKVGGSGLYNLINLYSPNVTINSGGNAYGIAQCEGIYGTVAVVANSTGNVSLTNTAIGFYDCKNISAQSIQVSGHAGIGIHLDGNSYASNGGNGFAFSKCVDVSVANNITIDFTGGLGSSGTWSEGGCGCGFAECDNIYFGSMNITVRGGSAGQRREILPRDQYMLRASTGGSPMIATKSNNIQGGTIQANLIGGSGRDGGSEQGTSGTATAFHACHNISADIYITFSCGAGNKRNYTGFNNCTRVPIASAVHWQTDTPDKYTPDTEARFLSFSPAKRNQHQTIEWTYITQSTGATLLYQNSVLQASKDSAKWQTIYSGAATNYENLITNEQLIRYRVYMEAGSVADESEPIAVIISIPMIVGDEGDLGTFDQSFSPYTYSLAKEIDDTEIWDTAQIEERIDGVAINNHTLSIGSSATIDLNGVNWHEILNGQHTLTISAYVEATGGMADKTLTFIKDENVIRFELANAFEDSLRPEEIILNPS
ncbi:MAG: hypothetical protein LBN32_01870, partial [Helicobacteraceae bacterium]|nr:hypothetical protein [Helicobacteraceae bacterium]